MCMENTRAVYKTFAAFLDMFIIDPIMQRFNYLSIIFECMVHSVHV